MDSQPVALPEAETIRITRLYEESAARLIEAARIAAQALGQKNAVTKIRYQYSIEAPRENPGATPEYAWPVGNRLYWVEDGGCGYYDFDTQVCVAGPCS